MSATSLRDPTSTAGANAALRLVAELLTAGSIGVVSCVGYSYPDVGGARGTCDRTRRRRISRGVFMHLTQMAHGWCTLGKNSLPGGLQALWASAHFQSREAGCIVPRSWRNRQRLIRHIGKIGKRAEVIGRLHASPTEPAHVINTAILPVRQILSTIEL